MINVFEDRLVSVPPGLQSKILLNYFHLDCGKQHPLSILSRVVILKSLHPKERGRGAMLVMETQHIVHSRQTHIL